MWWGAERESKYVQGMDGVHIMSTSLTILMHICVNEPASYPSHYLIPAEAEA